MTPEAIDRTLHALASPLRRGIVDLLRRKPRRASDLARAFRTTPPAMSRHLRLLRRTGLVEERIDQQDARARLYRLKPEPFASLRVWLDEVEAFWSAELEAFKRHAERHGERAASVPRAAPPAPRSMRRRTPGTRKP